MLDAISADLNRPEFRGCAFHNASTEFDDPTHPARAAAHLGPEGPAAAGMTLAHDLVEAG